MKKLTALLLVIVMLLGMATACAETVVNRRMTVTAADYSREGLYTGEIKNGQPHGFGVFVAQNGAGVAWHYIGAWKNGLMEGEGGTYWDDGSLEIGVYKRGAMVSGRVIDGDGKTRAIGSTDTAKTGSGSTVRQTYIGNKSSKKFHLPSCTGVRSMKEKNKITFGSRKDAVSHGYVPCKICNP